MEKEQPAEAVGRQDGWSELCSGSRAGVINHGSSTVARFTIRAQDSGGVCGARREMGCTSLGTT